MNNEKLFENIKLLAASGAVLNDYSSNLLTIPEGVPDVACQFNFRHKDVIKISALFFPKSFDLFESLDDVTQSIISSNVASTFAVGFHGLGQPYDSDIVIATSSGFKHPGWGIDTKSGLIIDIPIKRKDFDTIKGWGLVEVTKAVIHLLPAVMVVIEDGMKLVTPPTFS